MTCSTPNRPLPATPRATLAASVTILPISMASPTFSAVALRAVQLLDLPMAISTTRRPMAKFVALTQGYILNIAVGLPEFDSCYDLFYFAASC